MMLSAETGRTGGMNLLVDRVKARELLQALLDLSNRVDCSDRRAVDSLREKTNASVRQIFGETSEYLDDLRRIRYHPENIGALSDGTLESNRARAAGVAKLAGVVRDMLMEVLTGR
jgi:hypothetical protein